MGYAHWTKRESKGPQGEKLYEVNESQSEAPNEAFASNDPKKLKTDGPQF